MHILLLPSRYPADQKDIRGVFFRNQALALSPLGHKVGVIAPIMRSMKKFLSCSRPEKSMRIENDNGVVTYRRHMWAALPRIPYGNYLLWKRVADQLLKQYIEEQGRPDIIHAHSAIFAGTVAAQWKSRFGYPVVLTEHSSAFARGILRPWQLRLAKKAVKAADVQISVSPALGELLSANLGFDSNSWIWIPNIVAERFDQGNRIELGSNKKIRFLSLALMSENKGQLDLLKAFAKAFPDNEDYELIFAGDGPLKPKLEEEASRLGIIDRVHFKGRIPPTEVPDLLRTTDVMVVSSHYETFGLAAAEALMAGVPVVATRCGGPECIVEEGDGRLVPPRDPEALAGAMAEVAETAHEVDRWAIAQRAKARFSGEAVARQLTAIYENILSRNSQSCARA